MAGGVNIVAMNPHRRIGRQGDLEPLGGFARLGLRKRHGVEHLNGFTGVKPGNDFADEARATADVYIVLVHRASFLRDYSRLEPSPLEVFEKLEQLRALWHGLRIHVGIAEAVPAPGVDTEADLARVVRVLSGC